MTLDLDLILIFLRCAGFIPTYQQAGNAAQVGEAQFLFSATLAQTFNNHMLARACRACLYYRFRFTCGNLA
jgi:hypothetical protein